MSVAVLALCLGGNARAEVSYYHYVQPDDGENESDAAGQASPAVRYYAYPVVEEGSRPAAETKPVEPVHPMQAMGSPHSANNKVAAATPAHPKHIAHLAAEKKVASATPAHPKHIAHLAAEKKVASATPAHPKHIAHLVAEKKVASAAPAQPGHVTKLALVNLPKATWTRSLASATAPTSPQRPLENKRKQLAQSKPMPFTAPVKPAVLPAPIFVASASPPPSPPKPPMQALVSEPAPPFSQWATSLADSPMTGTEKTATADVQTESPATTGTSQSALVPSPLPAPPFTPVEFSSENASVTEARLPAQTRQQPVAAPATPLAVAPSARTAIPAAAQAVSAPPGQPVDHGTPSGREAPVAVLPRQTPAVAFLTGPSEAPVTMHVFEHPASASAAPLPWLTKPQADSKRDVAANASTGVNVSTARPTLLAYSNVQSGMTTALSAPAPVLTAAPATSYVFAQRTDADNAMAGLAPAAGSPSTVAVPASSPQPLLTLPGASGMPPVTPAAAIPAPVTVAPLTPPVITSAPLTPFSPPALPPLPGMPQPTVISPHAAPAVEPELTEIPHLPPIPTGGLSTESQHIVQKIPPERSSSRHKAQPVAIQHVHKNSMEGDEEVKKHDGVGISISMHSPRADTSQMLENAYDALIAGNQEQAIGLYKDVLANDPRNKLALFGLATTYHRAGQLQLARPLYGRLLAIDPHNTEGLNNFLVLLSDEAPREALVELESLEKTHPAFSPIPAQMAIIFEKLHNYPLAVQKMQQAIDISPENIKYQYDMAVMLDRRGDWANASMFYQQLLMASERGEKIPSSSEEIQERLTFIRSNAPRQ